MGWAWSVPARAAPPTVATFKSFDELRLSRRDERGAGASETSVAAQPVLQIL